MQRLERTGKMTWDEVNSDGQWEDRDVWRKLVETKRKRQVWLAGLEKCSPSYEVKTPSDPLTIGHGG